MKSLDPRQLATGKDGRLFIEVNGVNVFLAEVDTFAINMTVNSTDVQPVGSILSMGVPISVQYTLTFTEMMVRDDVNMMQIIDAIKRNKMPSFTFQTAVIAPDGAEQRIVCRRCFPSGEFNLQNLTPGEVVKRNQSYRINDVPEYISSLATRELAG
jgi:Protein of unknown function (DUF2001).